MAKDDTSIRIKTNTWKRLNARKGPGDSFDEVIGELLDAVEDEEGNTKPTPMATAD